MLLSPLMPTTAYFFFSSRRRHTRSLCDWSSDVCSSDLHLRARGHEDGRAVAPHDGDQRQHHRHHRPVGEREIGRASCRESVDLGGRRIIKKKKKKNIVTTKVEENYGSI